MKEDGKAAYSLGKAIKALSEPESYERVFHNTVMTEDMLSLQSIADIMELLNAILFPGYFGNTGVKPETMKFYMGVNIDKLFKLLQTQIKRGYCFHCANIDGTECKDCNKDSTEVALQFIERLSIIRELLATDVDAIFKYDPAALSKGEIIFAYPAIKAMTHYRVAHELYQLEVPIIPRIITEMAHSKTGIDIHPGAKIGSFFTIDHGTGVVIGETSVIGRNVRIYQGVTLGAKSFPVDANGNPLKIARHPKVEDDVIIYSGATILGNVTIGKGSIIGGNVWLTASTPPNSRILQNKPRETEFFDGGGI